MITAKCFVFRFADIELREDEFRATRAGQPLDIEPKAFRVLVYLLQHAGHLVTKNELIDAVWGDTAVTDNSLTRAIALLRRVLEDDPHHPRFIETVSTAGYRFICPVLEEALAPPQVPAMVRVSEFATEQAGSAEVRKAARTIRRRWLSASTLFGLALLALAIWYLRLPSPMLHVTDIVQITHDGYPKNLMGTDGPRLYFNGYLQSNLIAQITINGGEISPLPIALPEPWLYDVSPDGSTLLVQGNSSHAPTPIRELDKSGLWSVVLPGGPMRRLAEGAMLSAAWSPDGQSVVYSHQTGDGGIDLVHSDGTGTRRLLAGHYAKELRWSPDGSRIRFQEDLKFWEISRDGTGLHAVLPSAPASFIQISGQWSPDGKFFIFLAQDTSSARPQLTGQLLWEIREKRGLLPWASSEPVPLTSGPIAWRTPILSKDGKKIFAHGVVFRGELVRFDAQSNRLQPYLGGISAEGLSFSPDGRFMTYVSYPEGILWRANRDGSGVQQLTQPPMYVMMPRWSPDGTRILFGVYGGLVPGSPARAYIVSSMGGALERVPLPDDKGPYWDFSWSPDGRKITYFVGWGPDRNEIQILNLDSGQITTLPDSRGMFSPRWSPDGRFMAAMVAGSLDLRVFDFKTQRWSKTIQKGFTGYPTWSKDGTFLYFLIPEPENARGVYRIHPSGGPVERIVDLKGFRYTGFSHYWMGLDPDDTPMLLREMGSNDVYALTLER